MNKVGNNSNDKGVLNIASNVKEGLEDYLANSNEEEFHINGWESGNTIKAHGEGNRGNFGIVCTLQLEPKDHIAWLVFKQEQISGTVVRWGAEQPEACDVMMHFKEKYGNKETVEKMKALKVLKANEKQETTVGTPAKQGKGKKWNRSQDFKLDYEPQENEQE
ncbi:hypothetical protein NQ176_g2052 [Zarea fungicola]|uniref:Uncharacterized protein n=1 Tax=Zarea fungicola TaxID=93591 RepID=A0ACC1NRB1_9HYPO|nr:hypothetical protein NQ176_g2052 [Lecanicillium fungicola]